MMRGESCESDLNFDLLLAGDLPAADERRVRAHLAGCGACAGRWTELEAASQAFSASPPPRPIEVEVIRRRPAWGRLRTWSMAACAVAGAAALFFSLWPRDPALPGVTRDKGPGIFQAYVRHGDAVRPVGEAEVIHPDDQLQFVYSSRTPGFVAVLSRDGAGVATVYFPDGERFAWSAPAGNRRPLPRSTILDGTLGRELVWALFCSAPIELEPLRREVAAGRSLHAPPSCAVEVLQLDKRAPE
jgi:hypothetical protein